ncbi:MAG TPA: sugar phosphate isomerase/epimerase [Chloroflexi bacterium]|jgi:sugar phosphate isomerase/epimerase|nr:sugar phosphate isomerase/epimerase [Chloroflexota bacterium]
MATIPVGLQLYTVRDEAAKDFAGAMRRVAALGYAGVELAGTGGLSAAAMKDLLAETGLALVGSHVPVTEFEMDLDGVIAYYAAVGAPRVGVPYLPDERQNPEGYYALAAMMNDVGARLQEAGMGLYYHHHAFEFDDHDGVTGMDILLQETDPSLVTIECDVYWVRHAGLDPAAFLREHAGRFALVHLKDMTPEGSEGHTFAEVGEGVIDFGPIFAASEAQGVEWYIVEQDRCARPTFESARMSLENLRAWGKA